MRSIGRHVYVGCALGALLIFGLGGSAAVTSIESAVIAPATVVVEASRKSVQHDTGGIVSEIHVDNGDTVQRGDLLIRLDGTQLKAEIAGLEKRIFDYTIRRLRLTAEREGSDDLQVPPHLAFAAMRNGEFAQIIAVQRNLLVSRLQLRSTQRNQLGERIGQLREQINGLERIRKATDREMNIFDNEAKALETLREKRLVNIARYSALRRDQAKKRGLFGRTIADIARARAKISETELQIATLDVNAQSEILKEREAIESELAQLTERLRAAAARYTRLDIRASDDGVIHEMTAHTVGGVIQPGAVIAQIIPTRSRLVVDAMVQTIDRDQVHEGMVARVRFTAFNKRETPELIGAIKRVASDQSGGTGNVPPFYAVRITLDPEELSRLGNLSIKPGMPAEAIMTGQPRTILSYLTKPLTDQFGRAFQLSAGEAGRS
jgi:HlyD family secretion protein